MANVATASASAQHHTTFKGRLVFVGFGSIGQGVLPLILRHIGDLNPDRITIVTADPAGEAEAAGYGIAFKLQPLTRENFRAVLDPLVGPGDFLLNLSVDVSSVALIEYARLPLLPADEDRSGRA